MKSTYRYAPTMESDAAERALDRAQRLLIFAQRGLIDAAGLARGLAEAARSLEWSNDEDRPRRDAHLRHDRSA
jgi:hypothetical protein